MVGEPSGKPQQVLRRVDGRGKVTGQTRYTADESVPNMAHAVLLQSKISCGTVVAIDASAALALPGVLRVLSPFDDLGVHELSAELTEDLPGERRPPLIDRRVHYAGQHLALLVADTLETAQQAVPLIQVTYQEEPAQVDPMHVLHRGISAENTGWVRSGCYLPDHFTKLEEEKLQYTRGDAPNPSEVAAAIAEVYSTPVEHHNPIETCATLAYWEADRVTLHDTTRWLLGSRLTIASSLGLEEENVRILCPFLGGAFGSKGFLWQHSVLAALASRELGRPVKLVLSRQQMFTSVGHRPATLQQVSLKADSNHDIVSTEHQTLTETSPVANFVEPAGLSSKSLYRSAHVRVGHTVARLNRGTPVFMRAPGESSGLFALESAIDELAYSLTPPVDPLEFRLKNYAEEDADGPKPYASKQLRECYAAGAAKFGWSARPAEPKSMRREDRLVGQGMATATYPGRRMAASARATLSVQGVLTVSTATHELGNGVRTMLTQVAANACGLLTGSVRVLTGDSDFPPAPYTGASQTTASVGPAVQLAAGEIAEQMKRLAVTSAQSPFLGMHPDDLTLSNGFIVGRGIELSVPTLLEWSGKPLTAETTAQPPDGSHTQSHQSFGVHFAEVEVDETLGHVQVVRWVGAFDAGTVLNPQLARSQIMGGVVFGIGMALLEETHYLAGSGRPLNTNLAEYLLPTCADVPAIDVVLLSFPDLSLNALGARGIGELGIVGAPAAIANAVFHATGRRVRSLPIRSEHLLSKSH